MQKRFFINLLQIIHQMVMIIKALILSMINPLERVNENIVNKNAVEIENGNVRINNLILTIHHQKVMMI